MKTVREILVENNLDFRIEKLPTTATLSNGTVIPSPYFNLYKPSTGKIIQSVKKGYEFNQNEAHKNESHQI